MDRIRISSAFIMYSPYTKKAQRQQYIEKYLKPLFNDLLPTK